ncbi:YlxR family protein [Actinomadura flavalba]|uniref:YlxR family protein n=1 Tax=Actinomadura flavalba TaxID=1120938 RepID=UPI0003A668FE|nr:YlxR family protein [Actinomadura flavalba]
MRQVPPTPRRGRLQERDRAVPQRTCVGCRVRTAKSELLRLVVVEGVIVPDPAGRLPGRGAHLHPDPACLALAERRRAFPRAFRLAGPLDAAAVQDRLAVIAARQQDGRNGMYPAPAGLVRDV